MTKQLKTVKLKDIVPYENNPRHNEQAVDAVKESIRQCEYIAPIIVDEDMVILAGHTRHKALKALGKTEAEVMIVTGLTDDQKRKYRLLDNKTNELAEWDVDLLEVELDDLDFDGYDFGFDIEQIEPEPEVVEDNYTEEDVETRCKLGDLWQLGNHRLVCGDSTDVNVVERLMGGVKADMVFTDPPYGMGLDSDFSSMHSKMNTDFGDRKMKGTNYQIGKVDSFSAEMVDAIYSIDAPETFMWGADYYAELIPNRNDGSWIVWDKRTNESDIYENDEVALDRGYGSCFELCYSKKKHKRNIARIKWSGLFGMEQEFDRKRVHPTQKPVKLASWFIERYSKEGQTVVDIFGGSGSTLIACEQLGRACFMCELDEHYCDVIIDRWEQFTGKKAVLINE